MGTSVPDRAGTLRDATLTDAGSLARLFRSLDLKPLATATLSGWLDRGRLIVLDLGEDGLGAVAFVSLELRDHKVHACTQFLVVSPWLTGTEIEDRMAAAVLALCEASAWIDINAREDRPRRSG